MKPSSSQIIQFNAILNSLNLQDMKRELIANATDGRTDRTKQMSNVEICELIAYLNKEQKTEIKGNKIRRSIMSMCYQIGVISSEMSNEEKIAEIDKYIKSHPKTKDLEMKSFVFLPVAELQKLHYQFEVFLKCKLQGK